MIRTIIILLKIQIIYFLISMISPNISAQEIDFRQDTTFFKQQLPAYKQWLKEMGLEQVLKIHDINVSKKGFLLKLGFHYVDSDSASVAWYKLKEDFEKVNPFTLERQLFYKTIHIMEIPAAEAKIHVSDNWNLSEIPCLDGKIYLKDGVMKSTITFCRKEMKEITIPNFELKENLLISSKRIENKKFIELRNRRKIYRVIEKNAREYFKKDGVIFSVFERDSVLGFEVRNIKQEVISGSLVKWFDPHELLSFSIKYTPIKDGIIIYCEIDGKFGTGFFKPRSLKGFRDMSPEYKDELKRYTDTFVTEKISEWLSRDLN